MRTYKTSHIQSVEKAMLDRNRPDDAITLRSLSKRLKCSYFAAKRRLFSWQKTNKVVLLKTQKREGESGPISTAYYVSLR